MSSKNTSSFEDYQKEQDFLEGSGDSLSSNEKETFQKEQDDFLQRIPFASQKDIILKKAASESVEAELGKVIPFKKKSSDTIKISRQKLFVSALAIAAMFLISIQLYQPNEVDQYIGTKGSYQFGYYVKQGTQSIQLGKAGLKLKENDLIHFFYESPKTSYLMIVSVEESSKVSKHFPLDSSHSQKIAPGTKGSLDASIRLDSYQGKEKFIALFSKEPLDFAEVKRKIGYKLGQDKFFQTEQDILENASELSFWIEKE